MRIAHSTDPRQKDIDDFFYDIQDDFEFPAVYFYVHDPDGLATSPVGVIPNHLTYKGNEYGAANFYFFNRNGKTIKFEWVGDAGTNVVDNSMTELKTNFLMENIMPRYIPPTADDEYMIRTHLQMVLDGYYQRPSF